MSPGHFALAAQRTPPFQFASRLQQPSRRLPAHSGNCCGIPLRRLAWQDDALGREHRKFPFETRFDPGMLLDKSGHKAPQGQ
jgi:hypothetical protein